MVVVGVREEDMGQPWFRLGPCAGSGSRAEAFLEAGTAGLHFAGHMHVNDTGSLGGKESERDFITYRYLRWPPICRPTKFLTIEHPEEFRVETVSTRFGGRIRFSCFLCTALNDRSDSLKGHLQLLKPRKYFLPPRRGPLGPYDLPY